MLKAGVVMSDSPQKEPSPFNASGKTAASACGGALAMLYVLFHPGLFSAEGAGSLGVACSIVFSYFHDVVSELIRRYGPTPNP